MPSFLKLCWLNRHEPDRRDAWWDGGQFVSRCTHCEKPIRRVKHRVWVHDQRQHRLAPPVMHPPVT